MEFRFAQSSSFVVLALFSLVFKFIECRKIHDEEESSKRKRRKIEMNSRDELEQEKKGDNEMSDRNQTVAASSGEKSEDSSLIQSS